MPSSTPPNETDGNNHHGINASKEQHSQPVLHRMSPAQRRARVTVNIQFEGNHNDPRMEGVTIPNNTELVVNKFTATMANIATQWLTLLPHPCATEILGDLKYSHNGNNVTSNQSPANHQMPNGAIIILSLSPPAGNDISMDTSNNFIHLESGVFSIITSYLDRPSLVMFSSALTSARLDAVISSAELDDLLSTISVEDEQISKLKSAVFHCRQQVKHLKRAYRLSLASCTHCGKEEMANDPFKVCGGCNAFKYCSRECCVDDWPCHRSICSLYKSNRKLEDNPSFVGGVDVFKAVHKWKSCALTKSLRGHEQPEPID